MLNSLLAAALVAATWTAAGAETAGQLNDVIIKGEGQDGLSAGKPALDVPFDPNEAIRGALKPEESQLLAESPILSAWVRSRPDRLRNEHLLQPWNDSLRELGEQSLPARAELLNALGRAPSSAELNGATWSASVVDEDGKPFKRFAGEGFPPEAVLWNGLSEQGQWLSAGHSYSAVYKFSLGHAAERTVLGAPIQYPCLLRKEGEGHLIGIDSASFFGANRLGREVADAGKSCLRAAADWVRRDAFGSPLALKAYAVDLNTAQSQAAKARAALAAELEVPEDRIAVEAAAAPAAEQRLDLVVSGK